MTPTLPLLSIFSLLSLVCLTLRPSKNHSIFRNFVLAMLLATLSLCNGNSQENALARTALQQLDQKFRNVNMEDVKTKMDAITTNFNDNFMKVFGMDPDKIPSDVVRERDTRIPQQLAPHQVVRKNPGIMLSVHKQVIDRNLRLALPKILKAISLTPLPYIFQIVNVLVRNVKPTVTSRNPDWMQIDLDQMTNSLKITINQLDLLINCDIEVFLNLVPNLKGTLKVKAKAKKVVLRVYLTEDKKHYFFKPRIYMTFTEIDIDQQNIIFDLDMDMIPNSLVTFIPILFTEKIMPTITYYLQASTHDHTTEQMNAVIQNYFSDNIVLLENKLALCMLLTDKVRIQGNRLIVKVAGELFDPSKNFKISENPNQIEFNFSTQQNVQVGVAEHIFTTFFKMFFSNPQNSLLPVKILSKQYC